MKKLIILYSFLLIVFLCSCKSSIEYLSISDYDWYIESVSGDGLYKSVHYNEADLLDDFIFSDDIYIICDENNITFKAYDGINYQGEISTSGNIKTIIFNNGMIAYYQCYKKAFIDEIEYLEIEFNELKYIFTSEYKGITKNDYNYYVNNTIKSMKIDYINGSCKNSFNAFHHGKLEDNNLICLNCGLKINDYENLVYVSYNIDNNNNITHTDYINEYVGFYYKDNRLYMYNLTFSLIELYPEINEIVSSDIISMFYIITNSNSNEGDIVDGYIVLENQYYSYLEYLKNLTLIECDSNNDFVYIYTKKDMYIIDFKTDYSCFKVNDEFNYTYKYNTFNLNYGFSNLYELYLPIVFYEITGNILYNTYVIFNDLKILDAKTFIKDGHMYKIITDTDFSNYIDKEYEYCNLTVIGENETYSIVCFKDCSYNYLDILNFIGLNEEYKLYTTDEYIGCLESVLVTEDRVLYVKR